MQKNAFINMGYRFETGNKKLIFLGL